MLELLHLGGRSLPHAVLMMIPEAWENHARDGRASAAAFYEFHSSLMEPWDGPACVVFTDGTQIGAVLDRNGLRPSRYWVTDDGLVVLASEVGVLDLDPATIVRKGRLQPGRMFLVDTDEHRIIEDDEIKAELAAEHPYDEWLHAGLIHLDDLPDREHIVHTHASVTRRQQIFGYTEEELRVLLTPMANTGAEPIGSMGTDTPIAALSEKPRLLFDYFSQLFAQVTNPPLDAIREELVTSLAGHDRPGGQPARAGARRRAARWCCRSRSSPTTTWPRSATSTATATCPASSPTSSRGLYDVEGGGAAMAERIDEICAEVSAAIADGARDHRALRPPLDRGAGADPVAAAHRRGPPPPGPREDPHPGRAAGRGRRRPRGPPRRAAHRVRRRRGQPLPRDGVGRGPRPRRPTTSTVEPEQAVANLIKALGKGVLKVMSQDGRLHRRVVHRRPDLRGGRPRRRRWSTSTSPAPPPSSAASASTPSPRRSPAGTAVAYPRDGHRAGPPRSSRSAASTSGAARASPTCSTPRPSSGSSTPPATGRYDVFKQYTAARRRAVASG